MTGDWSWGRGGRLEKYWVLVPRRRKIGRSKVNFVKIRRGVSSCWQCMYFAYNVRSGVTGGDIE